MNTESKSKILDIIKPRYTELALFLTAISITLSIIMNWSNFVYYVRYLFAGALENLSARGFGVLFIYLMGMTLGYALSIYHIFFRLPKSNTERLFMTLFAILVNATAGVISAIYLFKISIGFMLILPAINILYSILLLLAFKKHGENLTSDEDENPKYLLIGLPILAVIFVLGYYVLSWNWTVTFSACVTYSMLFSNYAKSINVFN